MHLIRTLLLVACTTSVSVASDYRDDGNWDQGGYNDQGGYYGDDTMDYFDKSADAQQASGSGNLIKLAASSGLGWFVGGKIHSKRAAKSLKQKHSKERVAFVQLYREQVGALQVFNKESARIIQAMESSIIARQNGVPAEIDTVPFFMADSDGSKKISKAEFDRYVRDYLSKSGMRPEDIPRWESFDHDMSGQITFQEYSQQMSKQMVLARSSSTKVPSPYLRRLPPLVLSGPPLTPLAKPSSIGL